MTEQNRPPADSDPFEEPLAPLPAPPPTGEAHSPNPPEALAAEGPEAPRDSLPHSEAVVDRGPVERLQRLEPEPGAETTVSQVQETAAGWKFWRRPKKRDRQMETLRQGASEMVSLMRSIRDHLADESGDRAGLKKSLTPLPISVEGLQSMSESQADTGKMLGELRTTIERRAEKDSILIRSLNRIGSTMSNVEETFSLMDRTLAGMDQSNQRTSKSMEMLGDRMSDSGRFMNETFAQLRDAEREFTDHITRSSRRSGMTMAAMCCMLLLSVLAVGFMFKENRRLLTAVQQNGALVVQVPRASDSPKEVVIFEDLDQVDDGIEEPDREIVEKPDEVDLKKKEVVPIDTDGKGLLSVNKPPRRD